MKLQNQIVSFLISIITIFSCSKKIYRVAYPTLTDGRYDSEFPYKNCSQELATIGQSVTKLFCTTFYRNYFFSINRKLTRQDIHQKLFERADDFTDLNSTVAGTATVIYYQDNRIAILTCAHVVSKSDTIIMFHNKESGAASEYIQTIAIKQNQEILVSGMPEDGVFEILLMDGESDIAILHKELKRNPELMIPTLNYPFGKAKDLEWGSFVYLIGYPMGYKIITKGIVSQPDRDKRGAFLIDAFFNPGLSGGILLAIRDGVPNFEVVGITASAAAETETILIPERNRDYDATVPYDGKIFVDTKKNISYGITRAISAETILNLIRENRDYLLKKGYDFKF